MSRTYGTLFEKLIAATDGAVQKKVYSIYETAMEGAENTGLWDAAQRAVTSDERGRIHVDELEWMDNQTPNHLTGIRNVWMQFWQRQMVWRSNKRLLGGRQWVGNDDPESVTDPFDHKLKALDQANLLQKAVMYAAFSTVPGFRPEMFTDEEEDVAKYSRQQVWNLISANDDVHDVFATLSFSIPDAGDTEFELELRVYPETRIEESALPQRAVYWAQLVGQYLLDALAGPGDKISWHAAPDLHATAIFDVVEATRLWD